MPEFVLGEKTSVFDCRVYGLGRLGEPSLNKLSPFEPAISKFPSFTFLRRINYDEPTDIGIAWP